MAVPKFDAFLLPTLKYALRAGTVRTTELESWLADAFHLTEADRSTMIPSGYQRLTYNRSTWVLYCLTKAGWMKTQRRGEYAITESGRRAIDEFPEGLTRRQVAALWASASSADRPGQPDESQPGSAPPVETEETPEERIGRAYAEYRQKLKDEVLAAVDALTPDGFERMIIKLLEALKYGRGLGLSEHTGGRGDGGVDGIVYQDHFKLDRIYFQAKRYDPRGARVSPSEIRDFIGTMGIERATKGVFVTSGYFTGQAKETAESAPGRIVLIDRDELGDLMLERNVGVTSDGSAVYALKTLNKEFFEDF